MHVSVLMPTFNQASFIRRALESLCAQTLSDWELVIVDDGSSDETPEAIAPYLADIRISYYRLDSNQGLGVALNYALERARAQLVTYLPSDDVYYSNHLASLTNCLEAEADAVLAYSGVRHHLNNSSVGQIEEYPLQLVQVMHRLSDDRWIEREQLVTDDLDRMFWSKHRLRGKFIGTNQVSCEWVDHPLQRHKVIQEPIRGGINPYRSRYNVKHPLRFQSSKGHYIDEVEQYRQFRRPDTLVAADGLKIVLVGELAYNPERVLALEERGHKLYGLWTQEPWWFNTVGPLPFGHVEELPRSDWRSAMRRLQPDVIYALLNWQAVPFAHQVLIDNPGVPFVWHFKEGPWACLEKGTWAQLVDLHTRSDGQIYSSPEQRDWFGTVVPSCVSHSQSLVLDGDLPKREWFTQVRSRRLSESDGQIHTVVPGRPIGLYPSILGELARQGIHLHFYGADVHQSWWRLWIDKSQSIARDHLHLHPHVGQDQWVSEFSQYDAGWLHFFKSENEGDIRRAKWDDLNYPARIATLVAAGLPLIQYDNQGAVVAMQSLARQLDIGIYFTEVAGLGEQLSCAKMTQLRENVWCQREKFTFDYHADRLIDFLRHVIEKRTYRGLADPYSQPM